MEPKRCYGCMKLKQNSPVCEHCGYDERRANGPHQLPVGTILQGKYLVGRVLGQGGFGITYLGRDIKLDIPVAIKEYYPTGMVSRESSVDCAVTVATDGEDTRFAENRDRFLREAQTLARLEDVSEVVQVKNFFEENNTAYIVMGYVRGITLKEHMRRSGGKLPAREVFRLLEPLMEALGQVHELGLVHRDISPDNIMLQPNGRARLIDFGAAHAATAAGDKSTQAVLKHGFAPPEQYQSKGILGPWTDVYAMCATVYHLLTGLQPPNITDLLMGEADFEWEALQGLTPGQLAALKQGLALQYKERFQTMEQLCAKLFSQEEPVPQPTPMPEPIPRPQPQPVPEPKPVPQPEPKPQLKREEPSVSETGTVALIREETEVHAIHTAPVVRDTPAFTAPVERAAPPNTASAAAPNKKYRRRLGKHLVVGVLAIIVLLVMLIIPSAPPADVPSADYPSVSTQPLSTQPAVSQPIIITTEPTVSSGSRLLMRRGFNSMAFGTKANFTEIVSITFLDTTKDAPKDAVDASEYRDGSVLAWVIPNGNLYDLYLAADGKIVAPEYCSHMFSEWANLISIDFSSFDTSNVTDMSYMFYCCPSLRELDLSNFDTRNVTNMEGMFYDCPSLTKLDVSSFDTSQVTEMGAMFCQCESLTELDVSNFDTAKVTGMRFMFYYCRNLKELDLSSFDTGVVTDMAYMFENTQNLKNVNGNFDIRSVVDHDGFMDSRDTFNGKPWKELFR